MSQATQDLKVLPPGAATAPLRPTARDELAESTAYGVLYTHRLRRSQLALSVLSLVAFGVLVGSLPLVLALAPGLSSISVFGIPLGVVLVAVGVFPLFIGIALVYVRRAEALDEAFRELVREE